MCTYFSCTEKAKIKSLDTNGLPCKYYSRCQEHQDHARDDCKARYNRRKREKGEGK